MSQTTMPLLEVVEREYNAVQRAVRDLDNERWSHWAKGLGLLTRDHILQASHPDWQWGDYEI